MKRFQKSHVYVMIVVAVCVLAIFWCVNFRSPSSKESFFGPNEKFKFQDATVAPGNVGDVFYINNGKLFKKVEDASKNDVDVYPNFRFDRDWDKKEITVKGDFKIKMI